MQDITNLFKYISTKLALDFSTKVNKKVSEQRASCGWEPPTMVKLKKKRILYDRTDDELLSTRRPRDLQHSRNMNTTVLECGHREVKDHRRVRPKGSSKDMKTFYMGWRPGASADRPATELPKSLLKARVEFIRSGEQDAFECIKRLPNAYDSSVALPQRVGKWEHVAQSGAVRKKRIKTSAKLEFLSKIIGRERKRFFYKHSLSNWFPRDGFNFAAKVHDTFDLFW